MVCVSYLGGSIDNICTEEASSKTSLKNRSAGAFNPAVSQCVVASCMMHTQVAIHACTVCS